MFSATFNIRSTRAEPGTIYIRADGSIDPPSAPIQRSGSQYTLIDNMSSDGNGLVIERDSTVFDGNGHALMGGRSGEGITVLYRQNVTICNIDVIGFNTGISLWYSS